LFKLAEAMLHSSIESVHLDLSVQTIGRMCSIRSILGTHTRLSGDSGTVSNSTL
jgi:hypothetical protein